MELMQDLEMAALVGEVDPPRAEAMRAIAEARQAGIRVRMITVTTPSPQPRSPASWASRGGP